MRRPIYLAELALPSSHDIASVRWQCTDIHADDRHVGWNYPNYCIVFPYFSMCVLNSRFVISSIQFCQFNIPFFASVSLILWWVDLPRLFRAGCARYTARHFHFWLLSRLSCNLLIIFSLNPLASTSHAHSLSYLATCCCSTLCFPPPSKYSFNEVSNIGFPRSVLLTLLTSLSLLLILSYLFPFNYLFGFFGSFVSWVVVVYLRCIKFGGNFSWRTVLPYLCRSVRHRKVKGVVSASFLLSLSARQEG